MFKGFAGLLVVALVAITALPRNVEAQESAHIRVGARVVSSVIPETQSATIAQLSEFAATGFKDAAIVRQSVQTERGFAQVTTESLPPKGRFVSDRTQAGDDHVVENNQVRVLVTVTFTAN